MSNKLEWVKPMTSAKAEKYHMTKGFVAVELYDAKIRELKAENERLKEANAAGAKEIYMMQKVLATLKEENALLDDSRKQAEAMIRKAVTELRKLQHLDGNWPQCQEVVRRAMKIFGYPEDKPIARAGKEEPK